MKKDTRYRAWIEMPKYLWFNDVSFTLYREENPCKYSEEELSKMLIRHVSNNSTFTDSDNYYAASNLCELFTEEEIGELTNYYKKYSDVKFITEEVKLPITIDIGMTSWAVLYSDPSGYPVTNRVWRHSSVSFNWGEFCNLSVYEELPEHYQNKSKKIKEEQMENKMKEQIMSNEKIKVWAGFCSHEEVTTLNVGEVPYEEYTDFLPKSICIGEIDRQVYEKNKTISRSDAFNLLTGVDNSSREAIWACKAMELDEEDRSKRLHFMKKFYQDLTQWVYFPNELNKAFNKGICLMCWGKNKLVSKYGICFHCYCDSTMDDTEFYKLLNEISEKIQIEAKLKT